MSDVIKSSVVHIYFQKQNTVPKFYFIVDRLDLLIQASREFTSRGLIVHKINSREEFANEIKSTNVIHNDSGDPEITVVNIQKFKDDPDVVKNTDYNLNIQRIYFMDEVHRSYNPKGSFLANLNESDKNAIQNFEDGLLKNKTFLVTGKLNGISRAELKSLIEENSGKTVSSVSKKLNYLIIGDKPTKKKIDNAKQLKINVIDQAEFMRMLNKTS